MAIIHRDPFHALDRFDMKLWQPMRELAHFQEQMNQLFDQFMPEQKDRLASFDYSPAIEVEETDTELILKLETPGMEAKDLNVEVTDNTVTIQGERQVESKTEEKNTIRSEFQYGKFERMVQLPTHVDNNAAKAEYQDGILKLVLPKVESEAKRSVKVEITGA